MVVSILVVDDEADVAELFRQRFRREARQGTYVLHFAQSGDRALQLLDDDIEPELLAVLTLGFAGPLSASARADEDLE